MNPKLDYTVPADEIPQVRQRVIENAWADDAKLADACDNATVLSLLRLTHSGPMVALGELAAHIELSISSAIATDPSFSDWCDEAREQMATEGSASDEDDDPEIRALLL